METAEDFSEVEIENVEKSDEGEYSCKVKNDFGEDTCTVTLTVEGNSSVCVKMQILPTEFCLYPLDVCRRICVEIMKSRKRSQGRAPLILCKKEEMTEGRKASRASKSPHPRSPRASSRSLPATGS